MWRPRRPDPESLPRVCAALTSPRSLHGPQAHRISPGSEFGHEVVSEIAALGRSVKGFEIGQRVYPYPLLARGDTSRAGTLGGFSEYILVPDCELNRQLYAVSDKISSKTASLIEPFTVAHRAAGRAQPQIGETALVFGAGTIGSVPPSPSRSSAARRCSWSTCRTSDCKRQPTSALRRATHLAKASMTKLFSSLGRRPLSRCHIQRRHLH